MAILQVRGTDEELSRALGARYRFSARPWFAAVAILGSVPAAAAGGYLAS
jgi:hypothetical protein